MQYLTLTAHARSNDFIRQLIEGIMGSISPAWLRSSCNAVARQDDEVVNSVPVPQKGFSVASQLNAYGDGQA